MFLWQCTGGDQPGPDDDNEDGSTWIPAGYILSPGGNSGNYAMLSMAPEDFQWAMLITDSKTGPGGFGIFI